MLRGGYVVLLARFLERTRHRGTPSFLIYFQNVDSLARVSSLKGPRTLKTSLFKSLSRGCQVCRPFGVRRGNLNRSIDKLLDVVADPDFCCISAILSDNCSLIRYVLDPVNESEVLCQLTHHRKSGLSYSVRDPSISPSCVIGLNPANMRTGTRPTDAL